MVRLYLNVPYAEKDEAKALGAKWNAKIKKWYIEKKEEEYCKFSKWILRDTDVAFIAMSYIYIIEGKRECWKCGNTTTVIGLGLDEFVYLSREEDDYQNEIIESYINPTEILRIGWVDNPDDIPPKLLRYITEKYSVRMGYSKIAGRNFANHCDCCGAIQGNWNLFEEPDSPFDTCVEDDKLEEKISKLKIIGIPIEDNLQLKWLLSFGSDDFVYFQYSQFEELILSDDPLNECITYEELYEIESN